MRPDLAADSLALTAAVLVDFAPTDLGEADDADIVAFLDRCHHIRRDAEPARWALPENLRRTVLGRHATDTGPLVRARKQATRARDSSLQRALDRSLAQGWTPAEITGLSTAELRDLAVVAEWWGGPNPRVPAPSVVAPVLRRRNLFANARAMADDHFVGREGVLELLREQAGPRKGDVVMIHGIGGHGKSALISSHIVWAVDHADMRVAVLDFDDAMLEPEYPDNLVGAIANQLIRQVDASTLEQAVERESAVRDFIGYSMFRRESQSRSSSVTSDSELERALELAISPSGSPGGPVLIVLDTFEQVQRRGRFSVFSVLELVSALVGFPNVNVVICGRAELDLSVLPLRSDRPKPWFSRFRSVPLPGLERRDAIHLLASLTDGTAEAGAIETIVDRIGTSPLTLRLAARLILQQEIDLANDSIGDALRDSEIDAFLYDRILAHIPNPITRQLAHPGLVLRRITPDIIKTVLAPLSGIAFANDAEVRSAFEGFRSEVFMMQEDETGEVLTHRADIRAVMLPLILKDRETEAARVERAAIEYYTARHDPPSKVEELYHRLRTGQPETELAAHWDERAASSLLGLAADELPPASRAYLSAHAKRFELTDDELQHVGESDWVAQVLPQALGFLNSGLPGEALALVQSRRGSDGESLMPAIELEALEAMGDVPGAIAIGESALQRASDRDDREGVATFSLHLARLFELSGESEAARKVLLSALTGIGTDPLLQLRMLVALLGLYRRLGQEDSAEHGDLQAETLHLFDFVGLPAVEDTPGLLRDLAAELGRHAPADLLLNALRVVGFDAYHSGDVPEALAHANSRVESAGDGEENPVAKVAGLDESDTGVDWQQIIVMPRAETASAIAEILQSFPESSDELRDAIALDYQTESDAALFRRDLGEELGI